MRILFVSGETPIAPVGGISTYLKYIVSALERMGHEVFLFTFAQTGALKPPLKTAPFRQEHVHVEFYSTEDVHRSFPSLSHFTSLSYALAAPLEACINAWNIDVVEATDYQSPCLALFQKLQAEKGSDRRIFVTFNHGLGEVIFEADQIRYPEWAINNNLAERQQMRVSDLVVAPSHTILRCLRSLSVRKEAVVVREPYVFQCPEQLTPVRNQIQYMGRLTIQKGIDKLIYAANALNDVFPLRGVELIGRVGYTSFREKDIINYIEARLSPELRNSFSYVGYVPRDVALGMLTPGAVSPHLATDETFSYACIEAIDAGQLPIVRRGTAMAEFYPEHLQEFLLDEQMRSVRGLQKTLMRCIEHGDEIRAGVRDHCRETSDPGKISEDLTRAYSETLDRKRGWRAQATSRPIATVDDITILIPAYKPGAVFMETVDSIAAQTSGIPNVLICDDGTPDEETDWFAYALSRLPNARIVRQPNSGLLAARNTLIEECQTDLALFLDADDLLSPELLGHMLEAWNESALLPDAIIPARRNFGDNKELVLRNLLDDHLHFVENDFCMTALVRTVALREIGFDSTRRNGEGGDWAFWLDFSGRGYCGQVLPVAGFLHRRRRGSGASLHTEGQRIGTQTMIREVTSGILKRSPEISDAVVRAMFVLQQRQGN